jgi:hypothetical protein
MILVERGHMPPPEPGARGVFSMASVERTRLLLDDAGFSSIRTEEVPVRFAFRDIDDYQRWVIDVADPFAMVMRGLPEDERELLRARLGEAFVPFSADGGYELPGVALSALPLDKRSAISADGSFPMNAARPEPSPASAPWLRAVKSIMLREKRSSLATTKASALPRFSYSSAILIPGRRRSLAEQPSSSITSTRCQPRPWHSRRIASRCATRPAPSAPVPRYSRARSPGPALEGTLPRRDPGAGPSRGHFSYAGHHASVLCPIPENVGAGRSRPPISRSQARHVCRCCRVLCRPPVAHARLGHSPAAHERVSPSGRMGSSSCSRLLGWQRSTAQWTAASGSSATVPSDGRLRR